ncbi:peptidylprolyl isomerase [uncultured Enterovirga sp.]|uniref:peptidylprolyl isomerase n=1 Tax=uncultured Enterovirga sp. TaxID=2026352 RepID=UPI0035CC59BD
MKLALLSCVGTLALGLSLAAPALAQAPAPAPAAPAAAKPADPARVVARVDGEPITEADLTTAAEDPALSLPGTDEAQKREVLIGYVIDLRLGARASKSAKIDAAPEFRRRLAYFGEKLLVDEYLERQTKAAVTPEAAQKVFDETVKDMKPEEEVHARHILTTEEADAKTAYARVKAGEDFAKVAAELSTDPGSKTDGGDLGFFTRDRMVAPFAEAAFKMQPNEVSEPVKSQFGWHVIQVVARRAKPVPVFAEMREQIDQYLVRKAQQDAVLALRKTGKVERVDAPAAAAPKP